MICDVLKIPISDDGDILVIQADILPEEVERYKTKVLSWEASGLHLHRADGGFTNLIRLRNYNVILCRACKLRVRIPASVITVEDLLKWARQEQESGT